MDVMITDDTAPSYIERDCDGARLLRELEDAKRDKHVLNGATMGGDNFRLIESFCSEILAESI